MLRIYFSGNGKSCLLFMQIVFSDIQYSHYYRTKNLNAHSNSTIKHSNHTNLSIFEDIVRHKQTHTHMNEF